MYKQLRSIEKIDRDICFAGASFIGLYMEDLLCRISELENSDSKKKLIEEYHKNQQGYFDKELSGTTTRVNSVIRIIKAEMVEYALEKVIDSNNKVNEEVRNKTKDVLYKIRNGKLKLPVLEE